MYKLKFKNLDFMIVFIFDEDTVYYCVSYDESKDIKYSLYVYQYGKGSKLVASEISRINLSN